MCVKASLFVCCVCFFLHASTARPLPISHPQKMEVEKVKLSKLFGPNGRVTFGQRMPIKSTTEDLSKKYYKGGADYESSLHKERTKLEDFGWAEMNVREMDSSNLSEEALSETDYQQPQRKAPIHN